MRGNRETPPASGSNTPVGSLGERLVPAKRSNNEEQSLAESVEGSRSAGGNTGKTNTHGTQGRAQGRARANRKPFRKQHLPGAFPTFSRDGK